MLSASSARSANVSQELSDLTGSDSQSTTGSFNLNKLVLSEKPIPAEIEFIRPVPSNDSVLKKPMAVGCAPMSGPTHSSGPMHYEKVTRHITPLEVEFIKQLAKIRQVGGWVSKAQRGGALSPVEQQAYLNVLHQTAEAVTEILKQDHYAALFSSDLIQDMVDDVKAQIFSVC